MTRGWVMCPIHPVRLGWSRLSPHRRGGSTYSVRSLGYIGSGLDASGTNAVACFPRPCQPVLSSAGGSVLTCVESEREPLDTYSAPSNAFDVVLAPPIVLEASILDSLTSMASQPGIWTLRSFRCPKRPRRPSTGPTRWFYLLTWYHDVARPFRQRARSRRFHSPL